MLRLGYSALFIIALPLVLLRLWRRGRVDGEPGYRAHIGERFGRYRQAPLSDAIWVHAVSVGEVRAAVPLIRALQEKYTDVALLLTCMTPSGRAMAAALFGAEAGVTIAYLPYDLPWMTRRLLRHFKPRALLIMETEIWFNLVHVCHQVQLPVLLVNARLSARSQAGYARLAPIRTLAREALASMAVIAAQSAADAGRLESLGARKPVVTGNMKFDMPVDMSLAAAGAVWGRDVHAGNRQVLLLAATREGEESMLLNAFRGGFDDAARRQILLVIVPRHPQRFDEVFSLVRSAGFPLARRSATTTALEEIEVWLGDSMGEMAAYYSMCDLAIIGGSFEPLGGQNLIEAAAVGKPTIIGPHTFNFSEAVKHAGEAGALVQVNNAHEAMLTASTLLSDQAARAAMSTSALAFAAAHRGATHKTMTLITAAIDVQ